MTIPEFEEIFNMFAKKYNTGNIDLPPVQAIHDLTAGVNYYERLAQNLVKNEDKRSSYATMAATGRRGRARRKLLCLSKPTNGVN